MLNFWFGMELHRKEGVNNIGLKVLLVGVFSFLKHVNFLLPMASSAGDRHLKSVCGEGLQCFGEQGADTITSAWKLRLFFPLSHHIQMVSPHEDAA